MDVAAKVEQIVLVVDGDRFSWPFEDGSAVLVFEIIDFAVAVENSLGQQAGAWDVILTGKDMVMVG